MPAMWIDVECGNQHVARPYIADFSQEVPCKRCDARIVRVWRPQPYVFDGETPPKESVDDIVARLFPIAVARSGRMAHPDPPPEAVS